MERKTPNRPHRERRRMNDRTRDRQRKSETGDSWGSEEGGTEQGICSAHPSEGVGAGERGRGERKRGEGGRDSYSRAEGPPAIIFKPLQPTLELVEIKHRITGISASVPAPTTPQADSTDRRTGGQTHRQASSSRTMNERPQTDH